MIDYKNTNILVTGTSGFIGSRLAAKLLDLGANVYGVSRKERKSDTDLIWLQGDLSDSVFVEKIIKQIEPDYIFHLASHVLGARDFEYVQSTFTDNLVTTLNLLSVVQKCPCKRIILGGSFEEGLNQEAKTIPSSPYTASKIAAANYARMFYKLYKTPVCMTALYMVYGPGQKDLSKLVPHVILKTLKGESPEISSGVRMIDWIFVDDVVAGLIAMIDAKNIEGETIELGSGKSISIKDFVNLLTHMVDSNIQPKFGAVKDRVMEQENIADIEETFQKIKWEPETKLKEGLQKTINYYSNFNKKMGLFLLADIDYFQFLTALF